MPTVPPGAIPGVPAQYQAQAQRVLASLKTRFMVMPGSPNFPGRANFERAYGVFAESTRNGRDISDVTLLAATERDPLVWVVIRAILGLTPAEAVELARDLGERAGEAPIAGSPQDVREIDAQARRGEEILVQQGSGAGSTARRRDGIVRQVLAQLAKALCEQAERLGGDQVHRLDKVDTHDLPSSLVEVIEAGVVPYPEVLYERVLGRPFASYRDSVSERVGDVIDDAVEQLMLDNRIAYYKTRAREQIPGFVQAPDFLVPGKDRAVARVMIEDKVSEDPGTARDKIARVGQLRSHENARPAGQPRCQVVSVIDGRGFRERGPDLGNLLTACDGHVYTPELLHEMVQPGGLLEPFIGTV